MEGKTTTKLEFYNEEEGVLSLYEEEEELLRFLVYPFEDGEAEIKAQDVGLMREIQDYEIIPEIVTRRIISCLVSAFEVLEKAGYPETLIVTEKATKLEELLGSTNVVHRSHSELMMFLPPERVDDTINCSEREEIIHYEQVEEGYICRNEDRSFYAKVSPYRDGWYVYEVEVRYDRRRTGIATACMGVLAERFLQLYLQVGSYNVPAVRLYEKLGFCVIEELCYYGKA